MAAKAYGQMVFLTFLLSIFLSLGGCSKESTDITGTTVSGIVVDTEGAPVEGALIRVIDSELGTSTGSDGQFVLTIPQGQWNISAVRKSYLSTCTPVILEEARDYTNVINMHLSQHQELPYEPFTINVTPSSETVNTEEQVAITMVLKNNSNKSVIVSKVYFEAIDDRGQLVYRSPVLGSSYGIAPEGNISLKENWQWYLGQTMLPVILGNSLSIMAIAEISPMSENSIKERYTYASEPAKVTFENTSLSFYSIPQTTIIKGSSRTLLKKSGCVIRSQAELNTFLRTIGQPAPEHTIDFSKSSLLGVGGSFTGRTGCTVKITRITMVKTTCRSESKQIICNVSGIESPFDNPSSWQLVEIPVTNINSADVEFIWQNN